MDIPRLNGQLYHYRRVVAVAARQAHNLEVAGSNPVSAIGSRSLRRQIDGGNIISMLHSR